MRILDRYIAGSILQIFFLCLATFLFLFIIVDLFSHLDIILENRVGLALLRQYYLTLLPAVFIQVTPFACLLSSLYTFARLNHDNEIVAMRSSGLSIFQITKTAIVFGFIVSIFVFWLNDRIAPALRYRNSLLRERMENASPKPRSQGPQVLKNLTIYGTRNRLFYVNKFDTAKNEMEGIIILEHDVEQNIIRKIVARKGVYQDGIWKFFQSITYIFDENGQLKVAPQFAEEEVAPITETPKDFITQRQSTDFMSLSQIEDYIWRLSKSGASAAIRSLKVDYYDRFTMPLTNLIIIILGIPFALRIRRKATGLSSFGISIAVGFIYYVLNAISLALGKAGILSPLLAVSISHLLVLLWSIYLIGTLP
ncbi:MAG: LptF/LptG family permease [Candidatus Omnitrophica bacterium]|nr:LptF/LptG family permease [Candidatus Omnitrophota bacterium]